MKRTLADLVTAHPLLAGLPEDVLTHVAGCARNVSVHQGDLLMSEGEPADTFYLVRRGRVAIEVHSPGRGSIVIETVGAGGSVGWSWLVAPYRVQFDVRAIEPVGAIAIDGSCLREKAETDPAVGYLLMKRVVSVLLERLQMTRIRLLDLYGSGDAR